MIISKCKICGTDLTPRQITKKQVYCSRKCYYQSANGHSVSKETRDKIAATKVGKPRPKEMIDRVAAKIKENYATGKTVHWNLGKSVPEERKVRQSNKMKENYATGKIIHPMLGKHHTKESKEKIRIGKTGVPMSDIGKMHKRGKVASESTRQKMSESHIGGYWYGNVRYYDNPYCEKWTENLRERVRAFFNYTCFECGVKQNGRKINVHHVHYDKKTCCNGSPHDLVPLCPECHTKTNFNRDYWEDHFTERLYAVSPDGKCFFTKEEYAEFLSSVNSAI